MKNAWRSLGAGAALILLLTLVAYIPAMRGGFVFDDNVFITNNPMVKARDGFYRAWLMEGPDYYPLTRTLRWLEWQLWGDRVTGYHVVNVLLHAVNAVLVWMIFRRLKIPGAWVAGLVFALHPVNVATVAWISEQKNTLSMLFFALAILLYLKFDEGGRRRWYGLSLAAFSLALLSKTAIVMLPVVLLGCVWWRHGRVRRRDWLYSVPYFVASLVLALVTIVEHQRDLGGAAVRTGGLAARLAMAGWVPWFYLSKALLPVDLTVIYPRWEIDASRWISYVPGMILIGGLTVFWWKRQTWGRPLLFGLGYFVVMLFPVLGFFDQGFFYYSFVADHWQYYSIVGVIGLTAAGAAAICRRTGEPSRSIGVLASVVVLTALGVATWKRSCVYVNSGTLWQDNVAKNPEAWVAQYNLGNALSQAGRVQEAIVCYDRALRLKADYAEAHNNLGNALIKAGKVPEAIRHWGQAIGIKPNYAEAHNNLAIALAQLGKLPEAVEHFQQALRIRPDDGETHYNLGLALEQAGRVHEAMEHYESALRLKPDLAKAQKALARLQAVR